VQGDDLPLQLFIVGEACEELSQVVAQAPLQLFLPFELSSHLLDLVEEALLTQAQVLHN